MVLKYASGSKKEEINLSGDGIRAKLKKAGLYDYEWDVEEAKTRIGSKVKGFAMKSKKYDLILDFDGTKAERAQNAERFYQMIEDDVLNANIGRLYLRDYYLESYIIGIDSAETNKRGNVVQRKTKVFAPNPLWIREEKYIFSSYGLTSTNNKRYPGKWPYRYANGMNSGYIVNPHFTGSNFKLIIYGPVANPQVNIGGNRYLVNIVLEEGERLEIDSRSETIIKVMQNGTAVNAFHNREKGRMFFRKIQPGRQNVSWTGKFDFDLIIYEERSAPRWNV